ncbi:MAG: DAK2 domain-containing protein [Clostridia bacterium]|nr:DAK2 domain-containing protein [Clostridia bacterium]
MRETIDSALFTDMLLCAAAALEVNKQPINELNVFPVPDGDTGTNMSMTMGAGAAELIRKRPSSVGDVAKCAADALLRGARGNSGVILSLLFRGLAKVLKGKETCDAYDFALALNEGVEAAYNAVMKPAEGTILTVSRVSAAAAADFAETGTDIELLLSCALESAREALTQTVNQNPVLKKAGVVDAGGKGYVVILEAMLASLRGEVSPDSYDLSASEINEQADFANFDTGDITFAFDTVYIIRKTDSDKPLDKLRAYLDSIGDSLVISESDEIFKVHVHTNIPGDALTESQKYGTLELAKIENMRFQHDELVAAAGAEPEVSQPEKEFGSVVVCAGEGMASLFTELGADRIVTGGQTMNPSTEDILNAIEATPAAVVFVFPNNKNIIMAAEQCVPLTEKRVVIIPTTTIPQGVSAMLAMDTFTQTEEEIAEAAREAMKSVHTALITYAARDSDFDGYEIKSGEYLGLLDGALLGSSQSIDDLILKLSEKLKELAPEFLTVYYGEDVSAGDAEAVGELLSNELPSAEMSIINGGQPVYYYMISAE